jgi:hypothetical protein
MSTRTRPRTATSTMQYVYGNAAEINVANGSTPPVGATRQGSMLADSLHGRYTEQARRGRLFWSRALVTAPVIFSTAAGTGGPFLYNGTNTATGVNAALLGIAITSSVVSTVAAALGITGGPTTAPTGTTAIDSATNAMMSGSASQCTSYRVATPSAAGAFFLPLMSVHTGALTVDNTSTAFIDMGGSIICPPGYFMSIAASATATTLVAQIAMLWEEFPV